MNLFLIPLNPQRGLIYLLLALAETAWITGLTFLPLAKTVSYGAWFSALFWLTVVAILVGWLGQIYSLPFELARLMGLFLAGFGLLQLIRMALYPAFGWWQLGWLGQFFRGVFVNPSSVITVVIPVLLAGGYIWWRCLPLGQTPPELPVAGFTVQIGFLGLIGAVVLGATKWLSPPPVSLLLIFAAAGLLAMSLSYTQTITLNHGPDAAGAVSLRLLNGGVILAIVGGLALLLTALFSFETIAGIFRGLFVVLEAILSVIAIPVIWFLSLVGPLFDALMDWLRSMAAGPDAASLQSQPAPTPIPTEQVAPTTEPAWWTQYLIWGWRGLVLGLIGWGFYRLLGRWRKGAAGPGQVAGNQVQASVEAGSLGLSELWATGKEKLTDLVGLIRRLGRAEDLRAALTIRRIYAALVLLAGQNDLERPAAQTPNEFLHPLSDTWPQLSAQFTVITNAYIQVHYGQFPEGQVGLKKVQQAWEEVYQAITAGETESE